MPRTQTSDELCRRPAGAWGVPRASTACGPGVHDPRCGPRGHTGSPCGSWARGVCRDRCGRWRARPGLHNAPGRRGASGGHAGGDAGAGGTTARPAPPPPPKGPHSRSLRGGHACSSCVHVHAVIPAHQVAMHCLNCMFLIVNVPRSSQGTEAVMWIAAPSANMTGGTVTQADFFNDGKWSSSGPEDCRHSRGA